MTMRSITLIFVCIFVASVLTGCVAGSNDMAKTPDSNGHIAGFLLGLWQGFISPVTWFLSLFIKNINFYEVHNNGGWYNFGFVAGAGIIFGGSHGARKRHCYKK
jgi:hypothetical protein